jgi:TolB-like protein/Flp pilus assembly protein TadD
MKSHQQLFAELKRRHVFKVAAIYGFVSFGVLQAADLMLPRLGLPDWTVTFMVALVVLAFPVVLIIAWAFEVTPDGVKRTDEAPPGEIARLVAEPAAKRWPAGLLALVGVGALVAGAWWTGRQTAPGSGDAGTGDAARLALDWAEADARPSLAVFPFADMSPDGDQAYFSDGITEELLNVLAKVRELKVAARTSAFAFKGEDLTAQQLGDTLQVSYLVEGSVRKAGDRLRITAQLIDTRDGSHLWSEQYDRTLDDVFAIQTEIAEAIAGELRVPLGLDDPDDLVTPTADLEAYDLYLAGRARMRERGEGVAEAIQLYEAAIARDSNWAPAWAGLAESRATLPWYLPGPYADRAWAENLDAAERAAERALALDPANATAWVALGILHRERWDWQEAEDAFGRALALDPDNVEAHQQYAEYLACVGRLDEALAAARRALQLDRAPIRLNAVGYIAMFNRRYDEALAAYDEADRIDPEDRLGFLGYNRLRVYVNAGRWDEAREQIGRMQGILSGELRAALHAWPPDQPPSPEFVTLVTAGDGGYLSPFLWMALGERERALEALESYRRREFGERSTIWAPLLEPLLDEPLLLDILRKSNLEGRRPRRAAP